MRYYFAVLLIFLSLVSLSCEEDFNPKAEFNQKYVLWSIINYNVNYRSSIQSAVLTKLYDVEGYDPYVNEEDPVLMGADVRMYADNREYIFIQDTTIRRDTSRYKTPFIYYRTIEPVNINYDSKFKIVAKIPTGEVLTSETELPHNNGFEFSEYFYTGFSAIDRGRGDEWSVWWETDTDHIFFPRLVISYTKKEGDTLINKSVQVPLRYVNNEAHYPDYSTEPGVTFKYYAIDSAMAKISAGDPVKSNYRINSFTFSMIEYDTHLSNYYSSINGYLDNYSVRLDESVYTNISGGLGIFGTTYYNSMSFSVSDMYAKKFGYNSE